MNKNKISIKIAQDIDKDLALHGVYGAEQDGGWDRKAFRRAWRKIILKHMGKGSFVRRYICGPANSRGWSETKAVEIEDGVQYGIVHGKREKLGTHYSEKQIEEFLSLQLWKAV